MKDEIQNLNFSSNVIVEEDFDPLQDNEPDLEDESGEFYGEFNKKEPEELTAVIVDSRSAEERIDDLFTKMKYRRRVLLDILDLCQKPQPIKSVNEVVEANQKHDRSVFSTANFCTALEHAGALRRQDKHGALIDDENLSKPKTVVIDGVEYLEAAEITEVLWAATDEGLAALKANQPLSHLLNMLENDPHYKPIYKRVLTLCAQEGGASADVLGKAIDDDPVVQEPRRYAPYFFERLESCEALTWESTWKITKIGTKALEALDGVQDETLITLLEGE